METFLKTNSAGEHGTFHCPGRHAAGKGLRPSQGGRSHMVPGGTSPKLFPNGGY